MDEWLLGSFGALFATPYLIWSYFMSIPDEIVFELDAAGFSPGPEITKENVANAIVRLAAQYRSKLAEVIGLRRQLVAVEKREQALRNEIIGLQKTISKLEKKNGDLDWTVKHREVRIEELAKEVAALDEKLAARKSRRRH